MDNFKEKLKTALREKGISQKELANAIGMSEGGFIASVENNSIKMSTFEKICQHLDKPYSYFYESEPQIKDESIMSVMIDELMDEIKALRMKIISRENILKKNNINFHDVSKQVGVGIAA